MSASNDFYGEKYEQLVAAKPAIEKAGFGVPEMHGLSQSILDDVLHASSLPSIAEANQSELDRYEFEDQIAPPDDLLDHLLQVSRGLDAAFEGPLVLRSSGRGDSIGVGVYSSAVFSDNVESVRRAFKEVVASYFGEEGKNYRLRAKIPSGFGAFIQPLVGTVHEGISHYREAETAQIFDTLLSGNAKMGTPRNPKGSMKLQPGFGCAVAVPGLPSFDFNDAHSDNKLAEYEASELILLGTNSRNRGADDAVSGRRYVNEAGYGWIRNYGEFYPKERLATPETLTVGALKEYLVHIHSSLGSKPVYLELVFYLVS